jgi:hypothetical protein
MSTRIYDDVPAHILEREEGSAHPALPHHIQMGAAWPGFLNRTLPPVRGDRADTAGALRSPQGMADFLLSQGPNAAHDVSAAMATRNGFWRAVRREVEQLAPN